MHCIQCLRIGGYNFVAAFFALISTYANFELYCVEARYQEDHTERKYCNEHPRALGHKKRDDRETPNQSNDTHCHDRPHCIPNSFAFLL